MDVTRNGYVTVQNLTTLEAVALVRRMRVTEPKARWAIASDVVAVLPLVTSTGSIGAATTNPAVRNLVRQRAAVAMRHESLRQPQYRTRWLTLLKGFVE